MGNEGHSNLDAQATFTLLQGTVRDIICAHEAIPQLLESGSSPEGDHYDTQRHACHATT